MIPVLFKEDEQVFTHNGIGALYESLSCDVIEEENGSFTMELEYPVDGELFSELKDFRIIQAKPNDIDDPHNFRIYEIEKSIDELTVFVRANTRTNDLGNNLITNYIGKDVTPQQAMNGIKNNLIEGTNFDLISDIQTRSNVEWTRINPLNAIVGVRGSLVDIWGGQIKRTNTAIYLYSRRGKDNVVTIRPGKNIEGLNMTVSTAGLVTKILPTFSYRPVDVPKYQMVTSHDGTREKRRVQASGSTTLRDDITVLGDVVSSQYVDNYPTNYWSSVDYGDDEELKNTVDDFIDTRLTHAEESSGIVDMSGFDQELENFVKTELDKRAKRYFTHRNPGVDKPTVRIAVNMLQLSDSPDWEEFKDLERIGLTDTLDVWVEKYDIDVEVRVTTLTYDSIGELVKGFNAGSDRAPRQSAIEKKYDDLTNATNDYITSFKNGVQNIMRNTADGLNRKFEGYTEPPAELSSEGDIWFKEIGEGKVEIWIHDGVYWQPLMTEDFGNQLEAELEAAQAEIEEAKRQAKEDAEKAYNDARAHVDAELERINTELATDIGGAIDLAEQAKQDAIDRASKALEDAKDHADAEVEASKEYFENMIDNYEIVLDGDTIVTGDFGVSGSNVTLDADTRIQGDFLVTGGNVVLDGDTIVTGDFTVLGENIILDGNTTILGDFTVTGGNIILDGNTTVHDDFTVTGGNVVLDADTRVQGNFTVSGGNVILDGNTVVRGAFTVLGENVTLDGNTTVLGDFSVFGKNITLDGNTTILGDFSVFGKNIILDGDTTVNGDFTVSGSMVGSGIKAGNITTGTLDAGRITVINLDVSSLSGNISNFVSTAWNTAVGGSVRITGSGIVSTSDGGSTARVQNGVFLSTQPNGATVGYIGHAQTGASPRFTIQTSLGAHFQVRQAYINPSGERSNRHTLLMNANETLLDTDNFELIGGTRRLGFGWRHYISGTSDTSLTLTANSTLILRARETSVFSISSDGTTNHASMFANLNMQGNTVTNQSDVRLKTEIHTHIDSSLDKINQFRFVDFMWIRNGKVDFGLIAQEIQQIDETLIVEGEDGYLGLHNHRLNMMALHGLQEVSHKTESNEDKIKRLEKRVEELEGAL